MADLKQGLKPKSIKKVKTYLLEIEWSDFKGIVTLEQVRRECPCATCTGESVGSVVYSRPRKIRNEIGAFDLVELKVVGNYALAFSWANGHNTGIYPWEKIREIFERYSLSDEQLMELEEQNKKNEKKMVLDVMKK